MSDSKERLKLSLIKQYKSFRNYSLKVSVLLASIAFAGHFCLIAFSSSYDSFVLETAFFQSCLSAIALGVLGYCVGSFIGAMLQRKHYRKIAEIKENRRRTLDEELAMRYSKLEKMERECEFLNR